MKKTCPSCGGTGQVSYFQGVSRFLLTAEECPECAGIGHLDEKETKRKNQTLKPRPKTKKKKEQGG